MAASSDKVRVTGLYRYAVKGLSGDPLGSVHLETVGETFPDDRRYALLFEKNQENFNGQDWLHKENFLCAFTDSALMASLHSNYEIITAPTEQAKEDTITSPPQRILEIRDRVTKEILLEKTNLATQQGRANLGQFLSQQSGQQVVFVTAADDDKSSLSPHGFQFGNTSSGYKQNNGDTRTIHIVNENTVKAVSDAIGIKLDPRRFRPNLVINGPPAFAEFDWVKRQQSLVTPNGTGSLRALSRTVRCRGISIDPLDIESDSSAMTRNGVDGDPYKELDLPALLAKHFPQHGPYLGIYASLEKAPCSICLGDELQLSE